MLCWRCAVATKSFLSEGNHLSHRRPLRRNGLVQLGWLHFWLLAGILGGMVSLVGAIVLALVARQ